MALIWRGAENLKLTGRVLVKDGNASPTVLDFSIQSKLGKTVTFNLSYTDDKLPLNSATLYFGDGTSADVSGLTEITYVYPNYNTAYTATLELTDNENAVTTVNLNLTTDEAITGDNFFTSVALTSPSPTIIEYPTSTFVDVEYDSSYLTNIVTSSDLEILSLPTSTFVDVEYDSSYITNTPTSSAVTIFENPTSTFVDVEYNSAYITNTPTSSAVTIFDAPTTAQEWQA